ncbi:hypothetical protein LO772_19405 [Yinghuangia sp. ASG 101]|uniref:hypothetical protein n=1 Tax=Yinghuangia sp. ASG 101 TaxID=2896848 RepID=UPI001E4DE977|nr:hypothetical protein [Yinghuangia sp. ASG 101]UGQ09125.1 hypothetical protein LO772_19405 [Yinghuangia sp. ASG 101]
MHVDEARELRILSRRITAALVVVAVVAMVFTAVSVTTFALDHGVNRWVAWTLDPMVAVALLTVLLADARLVELGAAPSGWATALRWFAGAATWVMNAWSSVWPDGGFGVPRDVDPAGVVLHSVAPVLLVVLAEAATGYRRVIAARIRQLEASTQCGDRSLGVVVDDDGYGPLGVVSDDVRTADVVAWEEPWGAPWGDRLPEPLADPAQRQEIASPVATPAVTPVVAGWSSTTASNDHPGDHASGRRAVVEAVTPVVGSRSSGDRPHDHRDDQAVTTARPVEVVAPVVADRSAAAAETTTIDDHLDDQAAAEGYGPARPPSESDAELMRAARKLQTDALRTSRNPVTIQTLQTELGLSRRRATALRREVVGGAR